MEQEKRLEWSPEDVFELNGEEFGRILHTFRIALSTEEAQKIIQIYETSKMMDEKMKEYIEKGVIKEGSS
ncbi:MAG: hypothetical protein H5T96_09250 [Tissierellales bacterium]|nr:hypothetical protein [Tissierellales bacterium]